MLSFQFFTQQSKLLRDFSGEIGKVFRSGKLQKQQHKSWSSSTKHLRHYIVNRKRIWNILQNRFWFPRSTQSAYTAAAANALAAQPIRTKFLNTFLWFIDASSWVNVGTCGKCKLNFVEPTFCLNLSWRLNDFFATSLLAYSLLTLESWLIGSIEALSPVSASYFNYSARFNAAADKYLTPIILAEYFCDLFFALNR